MHTYTQRTQGHKETLELRDMFISLNMVIVSQIYICKYVQTHQIVLTKYAQFFVYQLYLNKAVKNLK